ncbi:MAG: hypothetical protein HY914_14580 [Desulfomonile tiedjei]|nr:hypothetical protein [Desulfomonile tiedjei]
MPRNKAAVFSRTLIVALLSILLVHHSNPSGLSAENNRRWHWSSTLSIHNGWRLLGGQADGTIRHGTITAELYDDNGFHGMSLRGSIDDDDLTVTVTRHGTDDEPQGLNGIITTFGDGRSSMLVFEDYAGGLVIGLTRA